VPLSVSEQIEIPDDELEWKFVRSSDRAVRTSTKFRAPCSCASCWRGTRACGAARGRLRRLAGQRLVDDGSILIAAAASVARERTAARRSNGSPS